MNPILQTTQVYIENQPAQWMLYTGKSSFGADPFAYTDSEEKANQIVRACNSYEAMREALKTILNTETAARIGSRCGALKGFDWEYHYDKVRAALTLADGKEAQP